MKHRIVDERAELHTYLELNEDVRSDFDYVAHDEYADPRFVYARGSWLDTSDMMMAREEWRTAGWDAEDVDTFFSATVIKFLDGDDEGFVRVGEYMS